MRGGHRLRRPIMTAPNPDEQFGDQVLRLVAKLRRVDDNLRWGSQSDATLEQRFGERFHQRLNGSGLSRKTSDRGPNPWVVV
jgi:hypothetical protein